MQSPEGSYQNSDNSQRFTAITGSTKFSPNANAPLPYVAATKTPVFSSRSETGTRGKWI